MIIDAVRTYRVRAPVTEPFRSAGGLISERADLLVELVTDDGNSGWGNGGNIAPGTGSLGRAAPQLLGVDPGKVDPRDVWTDLGAVLSIAELSAVDTAMWDLRGRALGHSIASLLGQESGHIRPQVRAYATGLFRRDSWTDADHASELVREAERYAANGFAAMKLKTGFSLTADLHHVASIREAIGAEVELYVDNNAAYTPEQSIALGESIAEFEIGWMEEPTGARDWAGHQQVRSALCALPAPIAVAGGEQLGTVSDFVAGCEAAAWDVVQPDVVSAGGITGMWQLGNLVRSKGMALVPHCFHTGIALTATLHLLSAQQLNPPDRGPMLAREPLLEYDQTEHPTREAIIDPPVSQSKGLVPVPDSPGLGVQVRRKVLEKYTAEAHTVASI